MSTAYGINSYKVTSGMVHSVTTYNTIIVSEGNTATDGSYQLTVYHTTEGCGTEADSGILVLLRDDILWTNITYEISLVGVASCWSFNVAGQQGAGTGTADGNLLAYDPSAGDIFTRANNSFEKSQFTTKTSACDNNSNNFFHGTYQTGNPKSFFSKRRRKAISAGLAGIHHGRSCNSKGVGNTTTIRNIRIW